MYCYPAPCVMSNIHTRPATVSIAWAAPTEDHRKLSAAFLAGKFIVWHGDTSFPMQEVTADEGNRNFVVALVLLWDTDRPVVLQPVR